MKLGFIGAGKIAPYHLAAARGAGFSEIYISAKNNSVNAREMADKYDLHFMASVSSLLETELDAIAVAVPTIKTLEVLSQCIRKEVPILVEKPVTTTPCVPEEILGKQDLIKVAYNRRFLSSVRDARAIIEQHPLGVFDAVIPEFSSNPRVAELELNNSITENAVHVFDLVRFLFGDIQTVERLNCQSDINRLYRSISVTTKSGKCGTLKVLNGVPEFYSLKYWASGLSLELQPIEVLVYNKEMHVNSGINHAKLRKYEKSLIDWEPSQIDIHFKPGFFLQYKAFYDFVKNPTEPTDLVSLVDALETTKLAMNFL